MDLKKVKITVLSGSQYLPKYGWKVWERHLQEGWKCNPHLIKMTYKGRRISFPFFTGIGYEGDEEDIKRDALISFQKDAQYGNEYNDDIEAFCDDFGYTDKKRARKALKNMNLMYRKAETLFKDELDEFLYETELE